MKGATCEDMEWSGLVLWLLVTDQEAHVTLDGEVTVKQSRRATRRRKRREGQATLEAAEAKRLRKMMKRAKS